MQISELLEIPQTLIKVIPTEIGGGFGGKISVYEQPVAVLLSKKSGRPVKVVLSRTDTFEATGPTPGSFIRVKLGADSTGRITAGEAWLAYEAGAFPGSPIGPGCMCIFSCYDIPAARVEGYDVCVNKPRTNAYRAPGSTNAAFAVESVIEELCERLNIDPLAFRLKNAAREGTRRVDGIVYPGSAWLNAWKRSVLPITGTPRSARRRPLTHPQQPPTDTCRCRSTVQRTRSMVAALGQATGSTPVSVRRRPSM